MPRPASIPLWTAVLIYAGTAAATPALDCEDAARLVEQVRFQTLEALPPRSRVTLRTFGDDARQRLGSTIQLYLEAMGHDVIRVIARESPRRLEREVTFRSYEYGIELILAPGPGCPAS